MRDPYRYFRVEARELVDQLVRGTLDLERTPLAECVPSLLRFAHTLKGAARVVKQPEIADLAHDIEETLSAFRDSGTTLRRGQVDVILEVLDAIGAHVAALGSAPDVADGAAATRGASPVLPSDEAQPTLRAAVEEMDALIDGIAEASHRLASLGRALQKVDELLSLAALLGDHLRSPRGRSGVGVTDGTLTIAEEIRLALTALQGTTGADVEQLDRELTQVRAIAEQLRLVPVDIMTDVLDRTARDVAHSLGKAVRFETRGTAVKLDAHVVGIVQNALIQVVRNAVAHGIESESDRLAAGKPREGLVRLEVVRRGDWVSFTCRDDGRGVDIEAIRRAVLRKGQADADVRELDVDQLIRLLLGGGITTSPTVTGVSGRGVGLDVVRDAIGRLDGDVNVKTETGQGTTFELLVPVSLASLDGLMIESGGQTATLPLDAVRRTLRLRASELIHTAEGDSIVFEGAAVAFAPLAPMVRGTFDARSHRDAWSVVVIESRGGARAAFGVDRLLGTERVVVRPLTRLTPSHALVAGASLDSDGDPRIVLDPEALVEAIGRQAVGAVKVHDERRLILVIDDSLTTRMLEQSILESAGYDVDLAISGEEALMKARSRPYALFLVDVEMPGMDGFDFIAQARVDAALRDIPSILVTSRGSAADRSRGEEAGARAYIVKSEFDQADLLARIRELTA